MNGKTGLTTIIGILTAVILAATFSAADACTVFRLGCGGSALMGNNEDSADPGSMMFVEPAVEGRLGAVYFGSSDGFRQGGVNSRGLCFDMTATPAMEPRPRPGCAEPEENLILRAMRECETVEEVVELFAGYELSDYRRVQMMFVDADGNSAVLDCNHVLRGEGDSQLITNFYLAAPELGRHPCERFATAERMLARAEPTVEAAFAVLDAAHQEDKSLTQYSCVYEPGRGRIHLAFFHNFTSPIVVDVDSLLSGGEREFPLSDLFEIVPCSYSRYVRRYENSLSAKFLECVEEEGVEAAVALYHEIKIRHSEILNQLAEIGFRLQGEGRDAEAAAAFGLMTADFPEFARGFEWLGRAQIAIEDYPGATASFERCLELDPENSTARQALPQLREAQ